MVKYDLPDSIKQAFGILLGELMESQELGEFWQEHYTDAERQVWGEDILTLAVVMVKTHKRIDDARNPNKSEQTDAKRNDSPAP